MLAKRFEVSRRTIQRDIDTLCLAGIPIKTTQGSEGGICIMEGYKLDKSMLTKDELQSIIIGLKSLESVSKGSKLESLMLKLSSKDNTEVTLQDKIIIDLSSHYKDSLSEKIELIKSAIKSCRLICFEYYYEKGQSSRKIEPYFIRFEHSAWYVFGFCRERQDFRLFKLNRLWGLFVTEEEFSPREITTEISGGSGYSDDQYNVKLLFDKSVRFRLIEDYGPNCYVETEKGLLLDLGYSNREYIKSWILGFGDKAEVLEPQDFKEEILRIARNIADKYLQT